MASAHWRTGDCTGSGGSGTLCPGNEPRGVLACMVPEGQAHPASGPGSLAAVHTDRSKPIGARLRACPGDMPRLCGPSSAKALIDGGGDDAAITIIIARQRHAHRYDRNAQLGAPMHL